MLDKERKMKHVVILSVFAISLLGCTKEQPQDTPDKPQHQESSVSSPQKIKVGMSSAKAIQLIKNAKWKTTPIPYEQEKQNHLYQAYSNGDELLILLYNRKTKIIEKLEYQETSEAPTEVITEYIIQPADALDTK